jgi:hypothetical protein
MVAGQEGGELGPGLLPALEAHADAAALLGVLVVGDPGSIDAVTPLALRFLVAHRLTSG